jgi:TonB-linked SusC/RagA family outer membrane protein
MKKTGFKRVLSLFILFYIVVTSPICAAGKDKFMGKVTDRAGEGLAGAVVKIVNTNIYTTTDKEGFFELDNESEKVVIEVMFLGFKTQRVSALKGVYLYVVMEEEHSLLDEIVVVGYGSQKRGSLSGAIESIPAGYINDRPVANLSRGLQGLVPNLNITMYDGNPSRNPTYNIRGVTSIGSGGNALVLIDGVEGDPNMVNVNDIENITVIKDASSAAIYGARGSFGVILITTRKPSSDKKASVFYSGNYSVYKRTVIPDLVTDGYIWASHFNEAHRQWYGQNPTAINSAFPFSQEYLAELEKRDLDPELSKIEINPSNGKYVYYDSFDWLKELYNDYNCGNEHSIRIAKSGDRTSYYLSGKIFNQEGIYRYNSDKYFTANMRGKGSIRVTDWLEVSDNFDLSSMNYKEPLYYGGWGFTSEISMGWSMRAFPVSPMLNPDGSITEMGARSVGDFYYGKNKAETDRNVVKNTISFKADLVENTLSLHGDYTISRTSQHKTRVYGPVPYENIPGQTTWLGTSMYFDHRTDITYQSYNIYSNMRKSFDKSIISLIAGFNSESSSLEYLEVSRDGILIHDRPGFSLSTGNNYNTVDKISEWNGAGLFARVNYEYDNRYYAEVNGRYDASSKFPSNQRWGFFPSVSGSWKISGEKFWKVSPEIISLIKVRASWGSLGNGNVDPYLYLESMPVSLSSRIINGVYPTMTQKPSVIPDGLTWEKATTVNFGADLEMFRKRLIASYDIYSRKTSDMFTQGPELPAVFGADVPKGNYADLVTNGWELSVSWNSKTKWRNPLSYGVRLILADNKSKITKYYNPTRSLSDYYEGMVLGEIWGYVTDGLFKDQGEIDNHADQSRFKSNNAGIILPGDIKFRNLNSDDEISPGNNTVDNPGDRQIIGNSMPRYTYGINLDFSMANLSLNLFLQGVGKRDWYPPSESYYFWGQYNRPYSPLPSSMLTDYYNSDPDNPNPDAYFPRYSALLAYTSTGSLYQKQTRYLQDASYLRLKSVTLAYDMPAKIANAIKADKIKLYITGQNLLTFSGLFRHTKNIDPETIEMINPDTGAAAFGGGNGYPIQKSFTLGINLTF